MKMFIRNFALLLLAVIGIIVLGPIAFFIQLVRKTIQGNMSQYFLNLATNLDYLGASLIFNTDGNTISAMVYLKEIHWAVKFINWIFQTPTHCMDAYHHEFVERGNL